MNAWFDTLQHSMSRFVVWGGRFNDLRIIEGVDGCFILEDVQYEFLHCGTVLLSTGRT